MKAFLVVISLILINICVFAQNKIKVKANISEVTVYSSSAEVKYKKEISLKKGKNIIIFSGLTPYIVDNSINVSINDKSVKIITVTDKINYLKSRKDSKSQSLLDSIENNKNKIELIESKSEVYRKEKELLFTDKGIGGVSSGVSVSEIEKASEFFNKRYSLLNTKLFDLNKQKQNLQKKNKKLRLQITEVTSNTSEYISEIIVVVNSQSNKKVTINFKFLTQNAGWSPLYDIKYLGPGKDLDFIFRANVFNASNTDWNDVSIKLSTASPTLGFSLPSLKSNKKNLNRQINYQNENIKFRTIKTNHAITEYKIDYDYTIPSDGKPYLVDVNTLKMKSEFSYLIIPKLDNNGFLMADIPNWNKYNIISGTTNIYNNGTFLGKTFLNTITTNDTLKVYLGKDNKIEAYRTEKNNEQPRKIIGNYFVDKTKVDFKIKNNYKNEVKIKLIDQVPVFSERDKVKMDISNIESANYNKSDGSITWTLNLKPNENMNMKFGYNIKAPKDKSEIVSNKKYKFRSISCPAF